MTPLTALGVAGFRRWSAYRAATWAGAVTNTVFGLIKAAIMTAAVASAGGALAGYSAREAATFAWVSQALLAPIGIFARDDLAQRVRSGDIAVDLSRPVDPQLAAWAGEVGRAAYQLLPRGLPPLAVGAVVTGLALPTSPHSYVLGAVSLLLGVSVSFACQWLVNLLAFWLLDIRGPLLLYIVVASVLSGLALPVAWFPDWLGTVAAATPFPSMLQAPADLLTGRVVGPEAIGVVLVQLLWLCTTVLAGRLVYALGVRALVVQGG